MDKHEPHEEEERGWKAWLWMAACCLPIIAILVLLALGYWGPR